MGHETRGIVLLLARDIRRSGRSVFIFFLSCASYRVMVVRGGRYWSAAVVVGRVRCSRGSSAVHIFLAVTALRTTFLSPRISGPPERVHAGPLQSCGRV